MQRLQCLLESIPVLLASGLLDTSGGNLSVRTDRGVLVTPSLSGEKLRWQLNIDDFVLFPGEGDASMARAGRRASRDNRVHRAILNARPDWNCVYHGHPWGLLAFCTAERPLPVPIGFSEHFGRRGAREIPVVQAISPGTAELADRTAAVIEEHFTGCTHGAVLLAGHGPVVAGSKVSSMLSLAQALENLARAQQWRLTGADSGSE
jgi:ribulose-5-phosphate 4-epimerase/fuculose-1-phosphate aldolase